MRSLDKQLRFAQAYRLWQNENPSHPYDSSKNPFHKDVLTELLILQDGLCAYTEFRLVSKEQLDAYQSGFISGKQTVAPQTKAMAHLDHFDNTKKEKNGWSWENFFAVFGPINEDKGSKPIDPLMKPDREGYDPTELLEYDENFHFFIPNPKRNPKEQETIRKMILVLGLNNPTIIIHRRKELIEAIRRQKWFGTPAEVDQFPTAFAMIQRNPSR